VSPEKIENPPAEDTEEVIADAFMALLASYNLQFEGLPINPIWSLKYLW
jgi:hypothetical protein